MKIPRITAVMRGIFVIGLSKLKMGFGGADTQGAHLEGSA